MEQLVVKTFPAETGKFVFYKARHQDPDSYARAIVYQSQKLDTSRVVAIEGVPHQAMPEFSRFLQERDSRITHVWQTYRSEAKGRFNLATDTKNFRPLAKSMATHIASIYADFLHQRSPGLSPLPTFPLPPCMASKMNVDRDDSGSIYTHDVSRDASSICGSFFSRVSLSTLGSDDDDQAASFPSLGQPSQPPPAYRSPTLKTPPPVSYVTAVRPAATPNTSDITATHASTDLQLQIQMLVQAQKQAAQDHANHVAAQAQQIAAQAKEIAELKALVVQAPMAPQGVQDSTDSHPLREPAVEAINPPPNIDRQYDQSLATNHTDPPLPATPPQTTKPAAVTHELIPPTNDPVSQAILQQLHSMATQMANMAVRLDAQQQVLAAIQPAALPDGFPKTQLMAQSHVPPAILHTNQEGTQRTPPSKKSRNQDNTPTDVDRLKKQMCQELSGSNDMEVDNGGGEGEIPPRPG
jgi:hypothetical protein